ncbi:MAG: SPOR domain-containing protein [Chitinispirillaceae bacterium]
MPFKTNGEGKKLIFKTVLVLFFAAGHVFPSAKTDASAVEKLLKRGKKTQAEALLEKALKKYPSDHRLKLLHFRTLPVKNALKLFDKYSCDTSVPPPFRAESYRLLGDHAFIHEEYKKAASFYELASWQDRASVYRHLAALSYYLDKDVKAAVPLWEKIAEKKSDELYTAAMLHLAYVSMDRKDWKEAYNILEKAGLPDKSSTYYVPFVLAMLDCAQKKGSITKVSLHEGQLLKVEGPLLEDGYEAKAVSRGAQERSNGKSASDSRNKVEKIQKEKRKQVSAELTEDKRKKNENTGIYTIQVGAFGSEDNARKMKSKLEASYENVMIQRATSGDRTLYRVRVGAFQTRDEASAFAEQKLKKAGFSTSIVKK